MTKILAIFGLWALTLTQTAIAQNPPKELQRIENIERIFMSRIDFYIVMVRSGPSEFQMKYILASGQGYEGETIFIPDVPAGKPMWVVKFEESVFWSPRHWLEFHIHAPSDVEGGGWTGRSGQTTTTGMNHVIE